MTRPELRIRTDRFVSNIHAVRDRIAPSELMVVLKDDAYGHGLDWAVEAARDAGVLWYGTYDVAGGVATRRVLGDDGRIFAWVTSTDAEIDEALARGIDLGVGSQEYLARIVARARERGATARIHLKIDTGLHRNGLLRRSGRRRPTRSAVPRQTGTFCSSASGVTSPRPATPRTTRPRPRSSRPSGSSRPRARHRRLST